MINKKTYHISLNTTIDERLCQMSAYYGITTPEMFRKAILEYFDGPYRKARYGFQSGHETQKRRVDVNRENEVKQQIFNTLETGSNDEIIKMLHDIGFIHEAYIESMGDNFRCFFINTKEGGARFFAAQYEGASMGDIYDWNELKSAVEKHLKNNPKILL